MYSSNHPTFTTVFDSAYSLANENLFIKNFTAESKAGNDREIIAIVGGIPELKNLTIKESYLPKSNELAKKFLNQADQADKIEIKISNLTNAIFAAKIESDDQTIFLDALIRRIRWSFASEHFKKCLKDCRYMSSLSKGEVFSNLKKENYQPYKIECLSYETRCLKMLGDTEEAKRLARDGIKEAKNYFQRMEEVGTPFSDEKKLERLRSFLAVLNDSQNDTKRSNAPRATSVRDERISIPEVSGKQNQGLKSCSDAVALRYDETKGRHLVATRNIKAGSVLIVDKPFAWSTDKEMLAYNCLNCHKSLESIEDIQIPCHNCRTVKFCSEDCRVESWEKYHRWECAIFDYFYQISKNQSSRLLLAYRTTVLLAASNIGRKDNEPFPELMKYYYSHDSDSRKLKIRLNDAYDPLDYRTVYSLQTNRKDIDPKVNLMHAIHSVLLAKCFRFMSNELNPNIDIGDDVESILAIAMLRHLQAINSNAYEIVENVLDTSTKIWEPRTVGGAIYATVSLTNHSCFPNVVRHTYPGGKVVVRAIRFIQKGAEILDCYGPHFLRDVKAERRDYLLQKYNFHCVCEACENNLGLPDSSALYKCKNCSIISEKLTTPCKKCGTRIDRVKIDKTIKESIQQRSIAIQKMLDGDYAAAWPLLLCHSEFVNKIFADYSLEAIKTQQALIQCLNSMGCIAE